MLTPEQARQRCIETRNSYAATRRYTDAYWTLCMAYNEGRQWGYLSEQSGNIELKNLKTVMDYHSSRRQRITINEIKGLVRKAVSQTNPQRIAATIKGPCGITDTYTRTASRVLQAVLCRVGALNQIRDANRDRHVVGSAGVRQVLRMTGPRQTVRPAQGRRKALEIAQYEVGWAPIMPWEIIRSPACKTVHMARDEEAVGHEKPRTTGWIANFYNGWRPKTETKLGQVVHYLDQIRHLQGGPAHGNFMDDAKDPAVLVEEFWLSDPAKSAEIYQRTGELVRFPWMFFGYVDPSEDSENILPIETVGKGGLLENPFTDLATYLLHYDVGTEAMWGTGMPWQLMQWQDFSNIAYTWLAEVLPQCSSKWRYQDNTLENPRKDLNNDPWQPIRWRKRNQFDNPPDRVAGAQLPAIASELVRMAPEGMNRQASIAPVQMGIGYRRDGSGKAYETLLEQAESVPEDQITSDEITFGRLLRATTIDTIRLSTVAQLERLTGGQVSRGLLLELKREDPRERIAEVEIHPSTMRPRTREQTEKRYVGLVVEQVLSPEDAVREATAAGVSGLNTPMERAVGKQQAEIERMRDGQFVEPLITENHQFHIHTCNLWLDDENTLDREPGWVERVMQHSLLHQQAQMETAGLAVGQIEPLGPAAAGRPSPPSAAMAPPAQVAPAGSAEPALRIA